jgi:hypothetical protein
VRRWEAEEGNGQKEEYGSFHAAIIGAVRPRVQPRRGCESGRAPVGSVRFLFRRRRSSAL